MQQPAGLSFAEIDGQLVARCSLPEPRPPLDLAAVRAMLEGSGLHKWSVSAAALAELVERWGREADAFEVVVARGEDASFSIEVGKDAQHAWVNVKPSRGGQPVQLDELLLALGAAGVVHGVDLAALQQACEQDLAVRVVAAVATPAVSGVDTRFELLVSDTRDRTPKVDDDGHIDFHQLGDIPLVKAGQPLMRRHPPTPGVPGRNVRGDVIMPVAGKNIGFDAKLTGATIDKDDPDLLRALFNGQPVHSNAAVMVEQVLRLKNVSMASGNIEFDGTVEIAEDVQPGMKVHATGDVVVKGTVEGAQIECGGNLQVSGGIIARAVVRAGVAASARFAENSEIHAKTVIAIADMAVHCTLEAHNEILVGAAAAQRSRLVGGSARAMMLVRVATLGAAAGGVTKVQVGVNPDLDHRLHELDALIESQKDQEEKLSKVVKHLTQHGDPRGMLAQVQASWKQVLAGWGESMEQKTEVQAQLALTAKARVEVATGVVGDIDLQFGKVLRRVRQRYGPGSFSLRAEGDVIFADNAGTVTVLG